MKNFIIILLVLICINVPAFSDYHTFPKDLSLQYKSEIEDIINKEIPLTKHSIKNVLNEAKREKNDYNRQLIIEQGIAINLFEFYKKLINATEKYVPINEYLPASDWYGELKKNLDPYLKNNNINVKKINKLLKYAEQKQYQLEKKYGYH